MSLELRYTGAFDCIMAWSSHAATMVVNSMQPYFLMISYMGETVDLFCPTACPVDLQLSPSTMS